MYYININYLIFIYFNKMNTITESYYDERTRNLLLGKLISDDDIYIREQNIDIDKFLFNRWCTIVSSLMVSHYEEYQQMMTNHDRNKWFQAYLNLDTHDMLLMPESLLHLF
jgi:hypothetical protein